MELRKTIQVVHKLLKQEKVEHALIGGLALSCYGSTRSTMDVDLLIHEDSKPKVKSSLKNIGFQIVFENEEVIQLQGIGYLDLLIARRPTSQQMLLKSNEGGPEGIKFVRPEDLIGLKIQAYKNDSKRELQDKADIQFLIQNVPNLNFILIKKYADLFDQWSFIEGLQKNKLG